MKLKCLAIGIPVALFAAGPAYASDKVLIGPPPEWVVQHPLPTAPPASADLPLEFLEVDTQMHVEGGTQTIYSVAAMKFLKSQGLQAGDLNLAWDPATETLTVNKVLIHRGDKTIDVLAQGQTFTVLRREQDLEQSTLTGTLTANLFPEGLQVGDVLEVASTRTRTNPVTGDHAEELFGPLNIPAGRIAVSLEWPKGHPMQLAKSTDLPPWQRGERGKFATASLSLDNAQPIITPTGAPARFGVVRLAEATDYTSWAQVADVFVPLYRKASQIPADGPLRAELDKIRAASKDPIAGAEAALQLVESRVRYVALEMGASGLVPADAAQTWSRKFGDCKAKTALLLGLLRELGIDAEPVVVSSSMGDAIHDRLPAVGLFDHILVKATIAGKTYWLDGTRTGDTSLARLRVPDFGWGLPIRPQSALVHIVPPPLDRPSDELAIELDASKGIRSPVPAKLEETLRGDQALGTEQALTALAGAARDQALRQYWRNQFDFIEPEKYDFTFDQATGELHLTMQGTATMEWDDGWYQTDKTNVGYRADFSRAAGVDHDAPFAVAYPVFDKTRETILLPPGFTGKVSSDKADVDETAGGFEYHRHATLSGNKFVVERSQRSLAPEISFKDAVASQKRLRDLDDNDVYLRIPSSYSPTAADIAAIVAMDSKDPAELVDQGETLEKAGKYAEALAKFQTATQLDPKNAEGWADRAFSHTQLGQLAEADSALRQAAALDPKNVVMLNTRGALDEKRHDFKAAVDDFEAVLKLYPDNDFAAQHRVSSLTELGRTKEALAALDDLIARHPNDIQNYSAKVFVLAKQEDRAALEKAIDAMAAAASGDAQANSMAIEMYTDFGFPEKARSALQAALAGPPTALLLYNKAKVLDASDSERALADLDAALRLDPRAMPALVLKAKLLNSAGRHDEAIVAANEAVRLAPNYSDARATRAAVLSASGKGAEAVADIDSAIAANPKSLDLYLSKANLLRKLGRRDDALKVAKAMVEASPNETFAHVAAAKIYDAFGDRTDALAQIDRALAIKPEAYIYLNRAQILPSEDLDGRLADIEKALALEPDMPEALTMKATVLTRKGDHAGAVDLWSALVKKEPDNASYLDERAIALWREGKQDEAQRDFAAEQKLAKGAEDLNNLCFQKATANLQLQLALDQCQESLRLEPGAAHVLDSRGAVYLQMGRYKEAQSDFDSALAKSPDLVSSLMGRAITRLRLGDKAGARADLAHALKIDADALAHFRASGFTVPPELAS
jgi:tetratricopeptide (TPR) repeat protein